MCVCGGGRAGVAGLCVLAQRPARRSLTQHDGRNTVRLTRRPRTRRPRPRPPRPPPAHARPPRRRRRHRLRTPYVRSHLAHTPPHAPHSEKHRARRLRPHHPARPRHHRPLQPQPPVPLQEKRRKAEQGPRACPPHLLAPTAPLTHRACCSQTGRRPHRLRVQPRRAHHPRPRQHQRPAVRPPLVQVLRHRPQRARQPRYVHATVPPQRRIASHRI